jgi:alpha-tubulin suppressor-like RCC1 family protein
MESVKAIVAQIKRGEVLNMLKRAKLQAGELAKLAFAKLKRLYRMKNVPVIAAVLAMAISLGTLLNIILDVGYGDPLPSFPTALEQYLPSRYEDWVPGDNATIEIPLVDIEWTEPTHINSFYDDDRGYEEQAWAYTGDTSAKYNGTATPDHLVIDEPTNTIRFLGTGVNAIMDMVYTDVYDDGFLMSSFTLTPINMNFHTFRETGFLFGGGFDGDVYTGYAVILENTHGYLSGPGYYNRFGEGVGDAVLSVYYIENEYFNKNSFKPGNVVTTRRLMGTIKDDIKQLSTEPFDIDVEKLPNGGFTVALDGRVCVEVDEPLGEETNGFGFYTGYYEHYCTVLTVMAFDGITIVEGGTEPVETGVTVRFLNYNDHSQVLAEEVTRPWNLAASDPIYAGDKYKVIPPESIGEYVYVAASRTTLDPITYRSNPANNVIELYYEKATTVSKNASVNGVADNGTYDNPVLVSVGDRIDYTLDINNPDGERVLPLYTVPTKMAKIWTDISSSSVFALGEDGNYYVWGENSYGQLGLSGDTTDKTSPVYNPELTAAVKASGGIKKVWFLDDNGEHIEMNNGDVYSMGGNGSQYGLGLGDGNTVNYAPLTKNESLTAAIAAHGAIADMWYDKLTLYYGSTIIKMADGTFYVCGSNTEGQLGLGNPITGLANTTTQKEFVINQTLTDLNIVELQFTALSGGTARAMAKTASGEYYAWGSNINSISLITTVTAASYTSIPTKVYSYSGPKMATIWSDANSDSVFALGTDGKIYVWGENSYGQLGLSGNTTDQFDPVYNAELTSLANANGGIRKVWFAGSFGAVGSYNTHVEMENGNVYSMGQNSDGVLGIGSLATPGGISTPTLNSSLTTAIGGHGHIAALWSASNSTILKLADGTFWVAGSNTNGQLGNNSTTSAIVFTQNPLLDALGITDIQMQSPKKGSSSAYAVAVVAHTTSGKIYVWGYNEYGQLLPVSAEVTIKVPTEIAPPAGSAKITRLALGINFSIGIGDDGNVYATGKNASYQLGLGNTTDQLSPVMIPQLSHDCAECILPTGVEIVDVKIFGKTVFAKASNGNWYTWGANTYSNTGSTADATVPSLNQDLTDVINGGGGVAEWYATNQRNSSNVVNDGSELYAIAIKLNNAYNGSDYYAWGFNAANTNYTAETNNANLYTAVTSQTFSGFLGKNATSSSTIAPWQPDLDVGIDKVYQTLRGVIFMGDDGDWYSFGKNATSSAETQGSLGIGYGLGRTYSNVPVATWNTHLNGEWLCDYEQIWISTDFTIMLGMDGNLYSIGGNTCGKLGVGDNTVRFRRTLVPELSPGSSGCILAPGEHIVDVFAQDYYDITATATVFAKSNLGNWYSWGYGTYGALGNNGFIDKYSPEFNTYLTDLENDHGGITKLNYVHYGTTAGCYAILAETGDGGYYEWGRGSSYLKGNGTTTDVSTPTYWAPQDLGGGISELHLTFGSCYIIKGNDGSWYVGGINGSGQLATGNTATQSTPVVSTSLNGLAIAQMKTGCNYVIAQMVNGDLYSWGTNAAGQLGINSTTTKSAPTKIELLSPSSSTCILPAGAVITDIWTSKNASNIAKDSAGNFYVWGNNNYYQLVNGSTSNVLKPELSAQLTALNASEGIVNIWAAEFSFIAKTGLDRFYVWGYGANYQLGNNSTTNVQTPTRNTKLEGLDIDEIYGGNHHYIAVTASGDIYVWGLNDYGQLGLEGNTTNQPEPVKNEALTNLGVREFALGYYTTYIITNDFAAYLCGSGGTLSMAEKNTTPVEIPSLSGMRIKDIWVTSNNNSSGVTSSTAFARRADGVYLGWGNGSSYALGNGSTTSPGGAVELEALSQLSKSNGIMGFYTMGTGTNNNSTIVVDGNGTLYGWGYTGTGVLMGLTSTQSRTPTKMGGLPHVPATFRYTDLLPAGLSAVQSGTPLTLDYTITTDDDITVPDLGNLTVTVNNVGGRDQIVFEFTTLPAGITRFHFSATVTADNSYFNNKATFSDEPRMDELDTNYSYHASGIHTVTEHYREYGASGLGDAAIKDDTQRAFGPDPLGDDYSPYPQYLQSFTDGVDTWRYWGYQRIAGDHHDGDDEPVRGPAPNGQNPDPSDPEYDEMYDWTWSDVDEDLDIVFIYIKDLKLNVDYKDVDDPTGANIKNRYTNNHVPGLVDYTLPTAHMNQFDQWIYAGKYSLDGGTTILDGAPPVPAYAAEDMVTEHTIVLYFEYVPLTSHVVTVQYREYKPTEAGRKNGQLLFDDNGLNKELFAVDIGDDFDALAQPVVADAIENGTTNIVGQEYTTYRGWSDDGGVTFHEGEPPVFEDIDADKTIVLYFTTSYVISEAFHTDTSPFESLLPDIETTVFGGETFTGEPPLTIDDGQNTWNYIGYKLTTDSNTLMEYGSPGYVPPVIQDVAGNERIIYVYHKGAAANDVTIVERFREYGNTGNILQDNVDSTVPTGSEFPGSHPDEITKEAVEYVYWGYILDDGEPIKGAFPGVTADEPHTVTYLYKKYTPLTITKTARVSDNWEDGPWSEWATGTEESPVEVLLGQFIQYKITVTCGSETEYFRLRDYVPEGTVWYDQTASFDLQVNNFDDENGNAVMLNTSEAAQGVEIPHEEGKVFEVYFTVRVIEPLDLIINTAYVNENESDPEIWGFEGETDPIESNSTYHYMNDTTPMIRKTARVASTLVGTAPNYTGTSWNDFDTGTAADPVNVVVGDYIQYSLTFRIYSDGRYIISDGIPKGLTFVSASDDATYSPPSGGVTTGGWLEWIFEDETAGTKTVTFVVQVTDEADSPYENRAIMNNNEPSEGGGYWESNYTYHEVDDGSSDTVKLHIRQIVVNPSQDVALPNAGYYDLTNASLTWSLVSESGVEGVGYGSDFTTYLLPSTGDPIYNVFDYIPQYYKYYGYVANAGDEAAGTLGGAEALNHYNSATRVLPTTTANGAIKLDYTDDNEWWLTVFITPEEDIGKNAGGSATNNFGAQTGSSYPYPLPE